jgi:CheY-like chemotaxis protein
VHTAEDGIEGCEILAAINIDLIISDIKMPEFNGIQLHDFARKMERYQRTKFIFISAYKGIYGEELNLDPALDFFFDKMNSIDEIMKFVDKQVFGDFADKWL